MSAAQSPRRTALPRLLSGVAAGRPMSFEEHLAVHGELPALGGRRKAGVSLIEELRRAGLGGRGGASFPTATKLEAVAKTRGRAIVVVNAAEGEPASRKDRVMLRSLPHLMLDGAMLAAEALGADEAIVCACEPADLDEVAAELPERRYAMSRHRIQVNFETVPHSFVSGEETALVRWLNGGPALPSFAPPRPFERGVQGRPTLVCNAETFAHVAMIARGGAEWFRELGTDSEPGSALVTLSGPIARPGVYEVERGVPLTALIEVAGGLTGQLRAALIGGYGGGWIGSEALDGVSLCDEALAPHGASLGAGIVVLLDSAACPVAETLRLVDWMESQSAGQCGPCVNGLHAISETLTRLTSGRAGTAGSSELLRFMSLTRTRGACRHPDGAVQMLESALAVFAEEFADHARHGPCEACNATPRLPLPTPAPSPIRSAELPGRDGERRPGRETRRGRVTA
jgi:NADH:ubiquinone oxidoreductase subunit F (NADH-binding)